MNNKLFRTLSGGLILPPDTVNAAGGAAYKRTPKEALAQFAATGCLGDTYYVSAEDQLKETLDLAKQCDPAWIAKCALYAREAGRMKDMPAVLAAVLAHRDVALLKRVWPRLIDNGKQLRNFVQVIRSGVVGRKSFGSAVKNLIRGWFAARSNESLFHASIGDKPSLGDIIKMTHPKPKDKAQEMMFAYLMGRDVAALGLLPEVVQQFEAAKLGAGEIPDINFQFLSSLKLTPEQWGLICDRCSWTTLRMNLNTFQRHGCFDDAARLNRVAARLCSPEEIAKARPMPHQLFAAYLHSDVQGLSHALSQAANLSLANIPDLPPNLVIGLDVSGSMSSPMTGGRGSATSKVTCVQTAALIAAAMQRKVPSARILPFDTRLHTGRVEGDGVLSLAATLAGFGGGGTDCSLPLRAASGFRAVDAVVIVSDNESWFSSGLYGRGTASVEAWRLLKKAHPAAKLVCIDLTPSSNRQTMSEPDVLNVGGFNDSVFEVVSQFLTQKKSWLEVIEAVDINAPAL